MEKSSTVVCIDGSTLSSLLFKLRNSLGDAEGFLVGEVCKRCVNDITDSQSAGTREEKKINILSFTVSNKRFSFYDCHGHPDLAKVEAALGSHYKHLVGWFSYRCNTGHRISLREKSVHRRLVDQLTHVPSQDFLFGLVTEGLVDQTPIHSTEYSFHIWNGCFQNVDTEVMNLRASGTVPYQTMSVSPDLVRSSQYAAILQEQSANFLSRDGQVNQATAVEGLYRSMLQRLKPLVSELAESNSEVVSLHQEVTRLNALAEELQREKMEFELQATNPTSNECSGSADNLINLDSPDHDKKGLSVTNEHLMNAASRHNQAATHISHDILSESVLDSSLNAPLAPLQPLESEDKRPTHRDNATEEVSTGKYIQQSQELF